MLNPDWSLDQYKGNQRLSSLFIAVIRPSVLASFRLSSPAGGVQGASQCPHCSFVQSKKTAQNIGPSHYNSNDRSGLKPSPVTPSVTPSVTTYLLHNQSVISRGDGLTVLLGKITERLCIYPPTAGRPPTSDSYYLHDR